LTGGGIWERGRGKATGGGGFKVVEREEINFLMGSPRRRGGRRRRKRAKKGTNPISISLFKAILPILEVPLLLETFKGDLGRGRGKGKLRREVLGQKGSNGG
jgi:hypothetical protein